MKFHHLRRALALAILLCPIGASAQPIAPFAGRPPRFEPIASFGVPGGVAEIVAASPSGQTLVYTDSGAQLVGIVDISNPRQPVQVASVAVPGEPTSVSIVQNFALVAVYADLPTVGAPAPAFLPGRLVIIDISTPSAPTVLAMHDIGHQPDSLKAFRWRNQIAAVIAIENQPTVVVNGLVTAEELPGSPNDQSPAGKIQVVRFPISDPTQLSVVDVNLDPAAMAAAGLLYPNDPQPEFVDIRDGLAAVSLQENNGIAIVNVVDPSMPRLVRVFSTGIAGDRPADLREERQINFNLRYPSSVGQPGLSLPTDAAGATIPAGTRMVDAVAWTKDGRMILTADEGEQNFTGGRGVAGFSPMGALVFEDRDLEQAAARIGQYPESRSANKGIEMEGVAVGTFGGQDFAFFLSERGCFMAIYELSRNGARPKLAQLVPTGISPEGVVCIEERNLVVTADEGSGTLSIFEATRRPTLPSPQRPQLVGTSLDRPFAALSGLAPAGPRALFSISDSAVPTVIYRIGLGGVMAPVSPVLPVLRNGVQATYDGEGLAIDTSILAPTTNAGFWFASEGNATSSPNLLVQVDGAGNVLREIQMPNAIDAGANAAIAGNARGPIGGQRIRSNGFEGMSISTDGRYLLAAIQREFNGEFASGQKFVRIARYDLQQLQGPGAGAITNGLRSGGDWDFFYLPLEAAVTPGSWVGLSEIITIGPDQYLIIERDNQISTRSFVKKVYAFSIAGLQADQDGVPDATDTALKVEVRDLLDEFFPYEKIEGLAILNGRLWVQLDNDAGEVEPRLLDTGVFVNPL